MLRIGYNPYVMRQHACLVINPNSVVGYASLFNCTTAIGPQTQWRPRHKAFTSGLGLDAMSSAWPAVVQLVVSFNSGLQWGISQEYSFVVSSHSDRFEFVLSLRYINWVRKPLCELNIFCIVCNRVFRWSGKNNQNNNNNSNPSLVLLVSVLRPIETSYDLNIIF